MRVLMVDDQKGVDLAQFMVENYARERNIDLGEFATADITVARTFEEGVALLKQGGYDVLMLDHNLGDPNKTGLNILERADEEQFRLPRKVYLITNDPFAGYDMLTILDRQRKTGLIDQYFWAQ